MLEIVGTIFSSVFAGGATGILGVITQRWADYKNRQLDLKLKQMEIDGELAKRKLDAEIMAQEWAGRAKVATVETEGRSDVAASETFAASFQLEPKRYADGPAPKGRLGAFGWFLLVCLDVFRGAIRPSLTIYLCVITTLIYLEAMRVLMSQALTVDQAYKLVTLIVSTILYLTTTCVLWWFGTRNKQAPPKMGG